MFKPSPYQQAYFDQIEKPNGDSLIVEAVAGSGKTTSICRSLELIPRDQKIIMVAFNKNIATELDSRTPANVLCKTCHSVGYKALNKYKGRGRLTVRGNKTWKILFNMRDDQEITKAEQSMYGAFVAKMVGLAKNAGICTDLLENTPENWLALADHHDVTLSHKDARMDVALSLCDRVLRKGNREWRSMIDFDDMIYLPILFGATFERFDWIFVDEAQDTNQVQSLMFECMMKVTSRIVFVGDPRQAIYGFRGADAAAMERLQSTFGCVSLPLSVSYRCATSIVAEAQKYCEQIEPFEKSPEGIVETVHTYTEDTFDTSDAILCRNTAPLVNMAYSLISRNIGVKFLGRDIGAGLLSLIKKMDADSIDNLITALDEWERRESERAREKKQESRIQSIEDKVTCIRVFIRNLPESNRTIPQLNANITSLFEEKKGDLITLCTIHKSKGKEWDRVFILDSDLMPSRWATRPWMREQEKNITYVAITRAKTRLSYIYSDCWGNEENITPRE